MSTMLSSSTAISSGSSAAVLHRLLVYTFVLLMNQVFLLSSCSSPARGLPDRGPDFLYWSRRRWRLPSHVVLMASWPA